MSNVYTLKFGTNGVDAVVNDTDPLLDAPGFEVRLNVGPIVIPFAKGDDANRWTTEAKRVIRINAYLWWAPSIVFGLAALHVWWMWFPAIGWAVAPWPYVTWRKGAYAGYWGCKTSGFGIDWPWRRVGERGYFLTPSARIADAAKEDQRGED